MLEKVDHIGIVVRDLDQAMKLYRDAFGIESGLVYEAEETKAKIAFFPVGEVKIELLQPTEANSVTGKFLEKRGEGIHHICFKVKDVDESLGVLASKGIQLVDQKARKVRENERNLYRNVKSGEGGDDRGEN